jgi:hypothetical protein
MEKLKKNILTTATGVMLATGAMGEIINPAPGSDPKFGGPPDVTTGLNFRVSNQNRVSFFGEVEVYAKPVRTDVVRKYPDIEAGMDTINGGWLTKTDIVKVPSMVFGLGGGAEVKLNKQNSIIAGIDIKQSLGSETQYNRTKLYTGVKRNFIISPIEKLGAHAGLMIEDQSVVSKDPDIDIGKRGFRRQGTEIGVEYERNMNNNLSLNARIGYSRDLSGGKYLKTDHYGSTVPKDHITASVGLHYRFPLKNPQLEMPDFGRAPKQKKYRQPKNIGRGMVPCPSFQQRGRGRI